MDLKKIISKCFVYSYILLATQFAFATQIDKIISFGDSLTDNGNIFSITRSAHKAARYFPIIPMNPPYYNGHFTNGPVWVENLALAMGVPLSDYAYAGAWAEGFFDSGQVIPFGLSMQVNFYLVSAALDFDKSKHLYTIWIGSNDYVSDREDKDYATTNTVNQIKTELEWLIYYGGKNFLIYNLPDLGKVPRVSMLGKDYANRISELARLHNEKLASMVKAMREKYPDVNLVPINLTEYFDDIINANQQGISSSHRLHLKNVSEACYGGKYFFNSASLAVPKEIAAAKENKLDIMKNPVLSVAYTNGKLAELGHRPCVNPDDYLFWDIIHPTRVVHASIAILTMEKLNEMGITA